MSNFDDILNQIKDSSGELKDNLHIMEEIVPIEEQMKYFDYSKRIRTEQSYVDRDGLIIKLFDTRVGIEEKRHILSTLAGIIDVVSYRAIETYYHGPVEPELVNWAALALVESRILIDSDLSGEKQFLVSTGLGGSAGRLRFFSVAATRNQGDFSDLQKEIVNREFKFQFEIEDVIIEEFGFGKNFVKMMILPNLKKDIKIIISNIIAECNQYGDFLDEKFILTNVRTFRNDEIEKLLKNKKNQE